MPLTFEMQYTITLPVAANTPNNITKAMTEGV